MLLSKTVKMGVVSTESGCGLEISHALCVHYYNRTPLQEILHPPLVYIRVNRVCTARVWLFKEQLFLCG